MSKEVVEISQNKWIPARRKRVAAYARVSSPKDAMLHSLAAQIDYYRNLILSNTSWEFAGVYADEGKTGTKEEREQFQALLEKCRAGEVDMVITKAISRLARNTVTLLATVRELKSYGVDVYFEEQNLHTLSADGEVMLTLLASFAQAESRSVSENCKWRIRNNFAKGQASTCTMLGYRLVDGEITIVPEEMETVRRIFELYQEGYGLTKITNTLNAEGRSTLHGNPWHTSSVARILDNEKYCGDLRLQKFFSSDYLKKQKTENTGQLPQYFVENDHEAIIDKADFTAVAAERSRRSIRKGEKGQLSALTGKIHCPYCGKNYRRKTILGHVKWNCSTYETKGKQYCPDSKMIPEETVLSLICGAMGTEEFDSEMFVSCVDHIEAHKGNIMRFFFTDGRTEDHTWADRSRAESWTPEMRAAARQYSERRWSNG